MMPRPAVRVVGSKRCGRAVLLRTTALQAAAILVTSLPAAAQPAPNARPQGGQVTAGAASIAGTATTTTINQSTARAAIDWTRFDVGSAHSVTFNQPSSAAVTLNRVTGPDPSAIAGRITANGQIVLTNPSGVVFYKGAEVNAQSVVISAAGITNQNFMAGRMAFDQRPNPGARIENHGTITVKQAGLAALVAPSVANSGVINARLARVVLAGAQTHTLDLYGDGLVAIDVTGQVRQAPKGADGKPVSALVTNTGAILADGGVVQLTAAAADGVVQTLVDAGGRVQANTVAGRTGRILITGTGGSVVVEGRIAADGRLAGSTGGQVEIHGDAATTIASGAHVSVSGRAGGGTAAIGTTLARAVTTGAATPGTSARTTVAAGARIAADATGRGQAERGQGGRVTVLSTQDSQIAGTLTARGGRQGGDGGTIEMSGERGFSLTGTANASAPHGALGTILLDPADLTIVGNGATNTIVPAPTNPNIAYTDAPGSSVVVREATVEGLTGNIQLRATNNLTVSAPLTLGAQDLTLEAGNNLTISAGFTVQAAGQINLSAGTPSFNPAGALSILGTVRSTGSNPVNVQLNAGTGGISIGGLVDAGGRLGVSTTGLLSDTPTAQIIASDLVGNAGLVSLASPINQIASIGGLSNFSTTGGFFTLATSGGLTIPAGSTLQAGGAITLTAGAAGALTISGTVRDTGGNIVSLNAGAGGIGIGGLVDAGGRLAISTTGPLAETGSGQVNTNDLFGTAGSVSLRTATNQVASVGTTRSFAATDFALVDSVPLTLGTLSPGGGGNIAVPAGHSITLVTDSLTISPSFGGAVLGAPGGTIVVSPLSVGRPIELTSSGSKTPGSLSLTTAELGGMNAGTLQLGELNALNNPTAGAVSVGRSGDVSSIDLGSLGFSALAVYAAGGVTQTVPLGVTSFQGQGGSLALINAANFIGTLNGFTTSTGSLDFHTGGSLAVTGAVSAQGGFGNVSLSSAAPAFNTSTLTLSANVTGDTVNLNSLSGGGSPGGGISQTGGIVTATTLTGAGYFARLGSANQVAQLGNFAVTTDLNLTSAHALSLTGAVASSAGIVTLNAPGITQLATSSLSAPELDGASSANVLLTSTANRVAAMGAFTMTGGDFTLVTASPALQFGAGTVDAGTGSLSFIADAVALGRAPVGFINAPSGTVTFAPLTAGRPVELIGASAATPGTLSLNPAFTSRITAATLALGDGATTGAITLGHANELISLRGHAGTLDLATSGAVSQGSGAALDVPALSGRTGDVTLGGANTIDTLGAYAVSTGGFSLNDAAPLTIAGPVNGGAAAAITAPALTISGSVAAASSLVLKASAADLLQTAGLIQTTSITGPGLELDAQLAVRQAGGSIATLTALTGTAGTAALTSTANSVPTLQRYITTTGDFALTDAAPLTVQGVLSASGDVALQTAGALAIDNTVTGRAGTLVSGGAITQSAAGAVTLASLDGSAGSVNLTQALNVIGTLGNFTAITGFSLATGSLFQANSLTVSGPLTAGSSITLNNFGPVTLAGTVQAPTVAIAANSTQNLLTFTTLNTDGTITQASGLVTAAPGGGFAAGSISLTAGDALTQGAGAMVATGPNSQVSLASHGLLNLGGAITGTTVNLTATTRLIPANPLQSAQTNPGIISQAGGATITGGLAVQADGAATLTAVANAVSSLGAVTSGGAFTLTDGVPLTALSPVTSPVAVTINAPSITLAASVTAPAITLDAFAGSLTQSAGVLGASGTLTLNAAGAVGQTGGTLAVGTLSGNAASAAFTQRGNSVGTLAAFAATTGDFTLVDSAALNVTGAVSAGSGHTLTLIDDTPNFAPGGSLAALGGTVSLQEYTVGRGVTLGAAGVPPVTAATLSIGALTGGPVSIVGAFNLTGVGVLDLLSGGAITETGAGALQAGTLTGSGASASLTGANRIGTLAGFTTTGAFSLANAQGLTVTGPLAAGTTASLDVTGALTLAGSVTAPTSLTLAATGAINQTAGVTTTASLSGRAASASLTGANQVATLAGFTTTGAFSLTDAQGLTIAAPLATGQAALDVTGDLALNSSVTGTAVNLLATGAITEGAGGSISAGILSTTARSATLAGSNAVTTLGNVTTQAGFSLVDGSALTVAGPVNDATTSVALRSTGLLTLVGPLSAPTVSLASAGPRGGINQSGGVITAGLLTGSATGAVSLGSTNAVGTLGSFSSVGGFALNTGALTLNGTLTDPTSVSLTTSALTLNGVVTTPALTLASGAVTQPGGALAVSTLSGTAASAALTQRGNSVDALGAFTSAGDFALVDSATALSIGGAVSVGAGHALTLTNDAPSLDFGGALSAHGGTVFLQEYTAGHGVAASSVNTNVPITAATLVVGTSNGGPAAITGAFNLPGVGVLDLLSAGAITETGAGSLQVAALEGSGGSASLMGANRIGTLAGFTTAGAFSLANAQDLRLAGPLAAGSASLVVTGDLTLASSITAPAALSLSVTGAISQTAGTITTANLSGRAASASLTDANQVAALGPFTTSGDFTLFDGRSLTVVAAVDPGVVTMNVIGDLVLNSSVTGTTVNLLATGVITEGAGGSITAGTLTANARSATLTGANAVTVLGNVTTQAGFSLVDGIALSVAGSVSDRASIALQSTGLLTLAGPLSAPTVSLASSSGITQAGGTITAGTLTGSSAGPVSLGASGNAITNLGTFTSAGFSLNDGIPLTLTGRLTDTAGVSLTTGALALDGVVSAPTLTLASGAVTQPGGALAVGTLSGTAASAAFTQRGNSVGALGAFTSSGDFSLVDGVPLTIGAPVTAGAGHTLTLAADAPIFAPGGSLAAPGGTVNLQEYTVGQGVTLGAATIGPITAATLAIGSPAGGPVTITGAFALSGVGVLDLLSAGAVSETGTGSLQADTLAGNAGSASLTGANRIGTLAGFATTGAFNLNDTQPLSVAGPLAAGPLTLAAPGITLAGPVTASSLTVMTPGNLVQTGGRTALGTLDGTVGQVVDLGTSGTLALAQLGSLSAGGSLSLVDGTGLTLAGALSAPNLAISATGTMTLAGGSITTTGLPPAQQSGATPAMPGSFLQVLAGPDGRGQFAQTGTTLVQPLGGDGSTLRIGLPAAGGSLTLAGLQAPRTTIILALGTGTATGTVSVGDLLVLGAGGTAALSGEVRHLTGFDASQVSHINPAVSQQYQLNGCAIASSNCLPASAILTPLAALLAVTGSGTSSGPGRSILRPDILTLDVLDLSVTRDRDDPTLLLPNISDRDY